MVSRSGLELWVLGFWGLGSKVSIRFRVHGATGESAYESCDSRIQRPRRCLGDRAILTHRPALL